MNETEIEALASAIAEHLVTSPTGQRADYLTQFKEGTGILSAMSPAAVQYRAAKVIRQHMDDHAATE